LELEVSLEVELMSWETRPPKTARTEIETRSSSSVNPDRAPRLERMPCTFFLIEKRGSARIIYYKGKGTSVSR
jgi:hypothetical protein